MKTRTGFVSNSSSSSFIAYGIAVTRDELTNLTKDYLLSSDLMTIADKALAYRYTYDSIKAECHKFKRGEITAEHFVDILTEDVYELSEQQIIGGDIGLVGGMHSFEEDLDGHGTNYFIGVMQDTDEYEITKMSEALDNLNVTSDKLTAFAELSNVIGRDHDLFFGTRAN